MSSVAGRLLARLLAIVACAGLVLASGTAAAQYGEERFDRPALDAMLAPIALYPDALLSHVLMAATYPDEIEEAAGWLRARPGLSGDAAVRTSLDHDWDPSVRSLLAFPMVLQTLATHPRWTADVGAAFLSQRAEVMETIQALRRRAYDAGTLRSNEAAAVSFTPNGIVIEQVSPATVHVPHYDPQVAYGGWWWPSHPPVHWPRWSGYADPLPGGRYLAWGPGVHVDSGFFFGSFVWPRHEVHVLHVHPYYYPRRFAERHVMPGRGPVVVHREARPGVWRHHEWRRRHREGRDHDHHRDGRHDDRQRDGRHGDRHDWHRDDDRRGSAVTRSHREGWRDETRMRRWGDRDGDGRRDERRGAPDRDRDGRPDWHRSNDRDRDGRPDWNRRSDRDGDGRPDWNPRSDRDGDGRPDWNRGRLDREHDGRADRRYGTDFDRRERGGHEHWRTQRPGRDEARMRARGETPPREAPRAVERTERREAATERRSERRDPRPQATPREARPLPKARVDPGDRH